MDYQINLNIQCLYKNLNLIYKSDEEVIDSKIIEELKLNFNNLLNIYSAKNKWKNIFELIEQIDFLVKTKSNTKFGQDELMYSIGNLFFKINSHLAAFEFYKKGISC